MPLARSLTERGDHQRERQQHGKDAFTPWWCVMLCYLCFSQVATCLCGWLCIAVVRSLHEQGVASLLLGCSTEQGSFVVCRNGASLAWVSRSKLSCFDNDDGEQKGQYSPWGVRLSGSVCWLQPAAAILAGLLRCGLRNLVGWTSTRSCLFPSTSVSCLGVRARAAASMKQAEICGALLFS